MALADILTNNFKISKRVLDLVELVEEKYKEEFKKIDQIAFENQAKVLNAFSDNRVGEAHFASTSGYGYNDLGRETLDAVYAQVFGCEDALVRHNLISGTHTLSTALFGVLRPGDTFLSVTGKPYDTLEEVIGIRGERGNGSLMDFGIKYKSIDLRNDGKIDTEAIKANLDNDVKLVFFQRSKGYGWRETLSVAAINEAIDFVKSINKDIICMVDNCYGEFSETSEPKADILVGSLIKNPGGGIAQTGGYIAGSKRCVELASYRLTSVGIGKECGATLNQNKYMFQGFFMAPHTVAQALKSSLLCSAVFDELGYEVCPKPGTAQADIISAIKFGNKDALIAFCQGIQQGAPVDSFAVPQPWDMPGYSDQVIMAAGAFVQGSSIELSADAPIKKPYIAYMQGGLTYESAKIGIMTAIQKVIG